MKVLSLYVETNLINAGKLSHSKVHNLLVDLRLRPTTRNDVIIASLVEGGTNNAGHFVRKAGATSATRRF